MGDPVRRGSGSDRADYLYDTGVCWWRAVGGSTLGSASPSRRTGNRGRS